MSTSEPDVVCEHGTAMDVHCCNCHTGFLFDVESCRCNITIPGRCTETNNRGVHCARLSGHDGPHKNGSYMWQDVSFPVNYE